MLASGILEAYIHDTRVLKLSGLFDLGENEQIFDITN